VKIYVASSWRNLYQPDVVRILRGQGHEVYDFRKPAPGNNGFHWSDIDGSWKGWTFERYRDALKHPVAEAGFAADMDALRWCDATVMVMPAGRSSHLELGWAAGASRRTAILYPVDVKASPVEGHRAGGGPCPGCGDLDGCWLPGKLKRDFEPELMAKIAGAVLIGRAELQAWAGGGAR
jgi:hypothetical protein